MRFETMFDKFWMWLAWLLPRRLVYWASIRLISAATVNQYSNTVVPDLSALDAIKRW